jgi:TetR/AcrR family transcriptional regulator, transcriptional repressor of aconitase
MHDEPMIPFAPAQKPNSTTTHGTPRLSRDRGPKTTRERILASAQRLFSERGFERVSMPAIAKASGITAGSIYKHFESKGELLFEVVRRALSSVPLFAASGSELDLLVPQVAIFTGRETKALRQLSLEIHSASRRHPRVRNVLRRALAMNIQYLRSTIEPAQRAGKIDPALDSDLLANAVIIFMMGLAHLETIAPHLVGNPGWQRFVENRVAALLGIRDRNAAAESE